jgi:MEMO1 family protein
MPHAPILVPGVGQGRIKPAARTVAAMKCAANRLNSRGPQALVLISPHSPRKAGAFGLWSGDRIYGDFEQFGAPAVVLDFPNHPAFETELHNQAARARINTWSISSQPLDHGALVPLWYAAEAGWSGPTVVLSLNYPGEGNLVEFGRALVHAATALGLRIGVIASGDMSHRLGINSPAGYEPRAGSFDRELIACLGRGEYRHLEQLDPRFRKLVAEDAVDSALVTAAALDWAATGHQVLSYEGPFGVGYGVAVMFDSGITTLGVEKPLLASD